MSYYSNLLRRVRVLENLLLEGKRDQEILNNFLGDDYYSKYQAIKNKIKDADYKDIYKLVKKDLDDVKDYIDNFQSKTSVKQKTKSSGSKLIYDKDGWKVYRITTYNAAQLYGKNTKWCITGRYAGHEERGEEYFDKYIETRKLDGGYYFYISDDNDKYCLLKKKDGTIDSIWMANDERVTSANILKVRPDFPSVSGVFEFNSKSNNKDEKKALLNKAIKKCSDDLKGYLDTYHENCSCENISVDGNSASFNFKVKLFFSNTKINGTVKLTYKSPVAFDFSYNFIDDDKTLNNGKGMSGTIKDLAVFENATESDDEVLYKEFYYAIMDADEQLE